MDCRQDQLRDLWGSARNENVVPLFRYYYKCHGSDSRALSPARALLSTGACATAGGLQSSDGPRSTPRTGAHSASTSTRGGRSHSYAWWLGTGLSGPMALMPISAPPLTSYDFAQIVSSLTPWAPCL